MIITVFIGNYRLFIDLWDNEKFFYPWPTADLHAICRPFHVSDLQEALDPSPVRKIVFIQVNQTYEETGITLFLTYKNNKLLKNNINDNYYNNNNTDDRNNVEYESNNICL